MRRKKSFFRFDADTGGAGGGEGALVLNGGNPGEIQNNDSLDSSSTRDGAADAAPSAPAAPPATSFPGILNDNGEFADGWQGALPEDLRERGWLKNFKSLEGMIRSHDDALKLVGKKGLIQPTAESSPEDIEAFYRQLGKPEKIEDYEFAAPELPEGLTFNEKVPAMFGELAHKANLTKEQAAQLWSGYVEIETGSFQQRQSEEVKSQAESLKELRSEWGNDYALKLDLANRVVRTFGIAELLEKKKLANDPGMARALAQIGASMSEAKLITAAGGGKTPAGAKAEADKLMADQAYLDPSHPGHEAVIRKYNDLMKQAYS